MVKAKLIKSQRLEDGSVSYLLKGPGDDKAMRHAAIDMENEEVEVTLAKTGEGPEEVTMERVQQAMMEAYRLFLLYTASQQKTGTQPPSTGEEAKTKGPDDLFVGKEPPTGDIEQTSPAPDDNAHAN